MTFVRYGMTAIAVIGIGLGQPAQSQGTRAVRDAMPGLKFDKQDQALMMTRVNQALRADTDGETLEWKSDRTPASGSVTALGRYQADGLSCQRLRIHNAYGELKAQGVYRFCEKLAGSWKLAGPDR